MSPWLRFLSGCCALVGATAWAAAEDGLVQLSNDVYLLPGKFAPGAQPDGNSVLLAGDTGWIVFDSGRHPAHAQRILDFVADDLSRIEAIVNSHWHLDHVGGNARIRTRFPDARVYASPGIEHALGTWLANYRKQLAAMVEDPKTPAGEREKYRLDMGLIDLGEQLHPTVPITGTRNLRIAGRQVRIGLETDAVTEGDLWLYDRGSRVLAAGDLVTLPVPFFDTACPARWSSALAGLEDMPFVRLVPGHGPALTRDDFTRYRHAFDGLLACAASEQTPAQCADEWIAHTAEFYPETEHQRVREMLDYYFSQHLRAEPAQRDRFCPAAAAG